MDSRTRKRYLAQVTAMSHLLQRHYSALPAGRSYADILSAGIAAALALGLEEVRREAARQRETTAPVVEDVPPVAVYDDPRMDMISTIAGSRPLGGGLWGLDLSLPRGDM